MEFTVWPRRQCNPHIEGHATNQENVSVSSQLEEAGMQGEDSGVWIVQKILSLGYLT